jgi:hypothetical protein
VCGFDIPFAGRRCPVIPAELVLVGIAVVIANVIAVAVFMLRWERRSASRQEEASPAAVETADRGSPAHPATPEQAQARADVLSG